MRRFFCEARLKDLSRVSLSGSEARHLHVVAKIGVGEKIILFDGGEEEYVGVVEKTSSRAVEVGLLGSRLAAKPPVSVSLAQSTLKNDKMKYVVQKSSEIGIEHIFPFVSERSISRPGADNRSDFSRKWEKVALSSAKQSGRRNILKVHPVKTFDEVMPVAARHDLSFLLAQSEASEHIGRILTRHEKAKSILMLVGPEGGFTDKEVSRAKAAGIMVANLGALVLRSDSVALAAGAIIMYQYTM